MATQTHEFKAKTVDDAIEEGLRILALARNDVDIEIVQKGSRGIFGLGSEPAIVRLTPHVIPAAKVVAPTTPIETAPPAVVEPPVTSAATATPSVVTASQETDTPTPLPAVTAEVVAESTATTVPTGTDEPIITDEPLKAEETASSGTPPATVVDEEEADRELATMATALLGELVRLMGFEAEIQASWQEEESELTDEPADGHDEEEDDETHVRAGRYLLLDIEGTDLGALIGRRGETLENIQYLLRLMVNQKVHKWKNIVIDVENYKARRVTQLTQLAERMAEQVARTGRSISLEPMPANERRIIHMTLRDHPDVYTESYGDGGRRKVHILAKT